MTMTVLKIAGGMVLGGTGGFLFQRLVGCPSGGGCPMLAHPLITTAIGALVGMVALSPNPKPKLTPLDQEVEVDNGLNRGAENGGTPPAAASK